MFEKEIFQLIESCLKKDKFLRLVPLKTFFGKEDPKPFILYSIKKEREGIGILQLQIHSDYKGIAQILTLKSALVDLLENVVHQSSKTCTVFKECHSGRKSFERASWECLPLIFTVKQFKKEQ